MEKWNLLSFFRTIHSQLAVRRGRHCRFLWRPCESCRAFSDRLTQIYVLQWLHSLLCDKSNDRLTSKKLKLKGAKFLTGKWLCELIVATMRKCISIQLETWKRQTITKHLNGDLGSVILKQFFSGRKRRLKNMGYVFICLFHHHLYQNHSIQIINPTRLTKMAKSRKLISKWYIISQNLKALCAMPNLKNSWHCPFDSS